MIFDIQRYSTHDGPGIRTVVFFKGCPLRCFWCENPEGQSFLPELLYSRSHCIRCGSCLAADKKGVLSRDIEGFIKIDRGATPSTECTRHCPSGALRVAGYQMSAHEIIQEVMKDNDFFRKSGGGLTISGGEPLAQPDFLLELIEEAQQKGLDIAIESSLFAPRSVVAEIAKHPLLWLADLKHVDPLAYRKGTSGDLEIAISNLRFLAQNDALFILRVPLIPGFNNNLEAVRRIFLTAAELYDMKKTPVQRQVDILPYHDLAKGKYASLGRKYPYPSGLRIPQDTLSEYVSLGTSFGLTIMIGG